MLTKPSLSGHGPDINKGRSYLTKVKLRGYHFGNVPYICIQE
jgi:hypothetical protein